MNVLFLEAQLTKKSLEPCFSSRLVLGVKTTPFPPRLKHKSVMLEIWNLVRNNRDTENILFIARTP